jgi:drug/metabolite transporter (DMT)-like permease
LVRTSALPRARAWSSTDLLMLAVVTIWGINFTLIKIALRDFSPMAFNGLRFGLATAIIMVILWAQARRSGDRDLLYVPRRDWLPVILLGLFGHTLYQVIFINGLSHTTPANSSLLMATSPIWVGIIGWLLRIERVNRLMWLGILLSFAGIIVLVMGGEAGISLDPAHLLGDGLILACALAWAIYTTASKPLLTRYSPLKLTAWSMLAGAIPLTLLSIPALAQQDWTVVSPAAWGGLVFSTLMALVAGYLIWYTSVQRVGNARTAVYSNLTPVIAIVFAWLTIGSALAPLQLLGGAIVLVGLVVTRRGRAH